MDILEPKPKGHLYYIKDVAILEQHDVTEFLIGYHDMTT